MGSTHSHSFIDATERVSVDRHVETLIDSVRQWKVESSSMSASMNSLTPEVAILRLNEQFKADEGMVPVMRVVGYFAGATTQDIMVKLTHERHRRQWDKNYLLFDKFPRFGGFAGGVFSDEEYTSPPQDFVWGVLPVLRRTFKPVYWSACRHCVGSTLLQKVGMTAREFQYNLVVSRAFLRPETTDVFSIVYSGRREPFRSPPFQCIPVKMHYQEVLLLPVCSAVEKERLFEAAQIGGSINDALPFVNMKDSSQGVMMVMTSCNDAKPPSVPSFLERTISMHFTSGAYSMLAESLLVRKDCH